MMPARVVRFVVVALGVGLATSGCRPADARDKIDTVELSKRAAKLEQALAQGRTMAFDTSAGTVDSIVTPDSVSSRQVADDSSGDGNKGTKNDGKKKESDAGNGKNQGKNAEEPEVTSAEAGAIAKWVLPRELDEISGAALTSDGRLLAHGDERGQISEIDYRRGVIVKQFVVGRPTLRADIEGITIVNGTVFLLTSKGILYEFREGANGTRVDYITSDTRLGKVCEFEGLAYDATINSLLLACKNVEDKNDRDHMVIYRWRLEGGGERISQIKVPLSKILPSIGEKEYHPSDITVDPKTGNYVLVAGIEEAIVEITPAGEVVFARKLTGEHNQPESIAITKDDILIISDEAGRRPASLTLYPWRRR